LSLLKTSLSAGAGASAASNAGEENTKTAEDIKKRMVFFIVILSKSGLTRTADKNNSGFL
jgi:hypothetical protein